MIKQEHTKLHEIIANLPQEQKDKFEVNTCMLSVLADMLDTVTGDINKALCTDKMFYELKVSDEVQKIHDIAKGLVKMFDTNCNMETAEDYGEFSDQLMPMLIKKTEEHIAWINLENKKQVMYAKKLRQ